VLLRKRFAGAVVCSVMMIVAGAPVASAATTGGVGVSEPSTSHATTKPPVHLFPVTSRTQNIAYHGPVYEKTASGALVPYTPPPAGTLPGATTTAGAASSMAGGSVAGSTKPATSTTPAAGPVQRPLLLVPGSRARYVNGVAAAPMGAPEVVQKIIWAGNELIGLPYIFGGGHASFVSPGYDCSGTVSFALHGAGLLSTPEDSSEFERWGSHGIGRWVAVFSNPGHAYMTVAGLRLDTSAADDPSNQQGPRWRPLRTGNEGFTARHPLGL
jgi:cell wall-associated NlpC family hydrolase